MKTQNTTAPQKTLRYEKPVLIEEGSLYKLTGDLTIPGGPVNGSL